MTAMLTAAFRPVFERLQQDAARRYGRPHVELVVSATDERPFSFIARVTVREHAAPLGSLYVKVYKTHALNGNVAAIRERVARDFATNNRVFDAMAGRQDIGAVPPVACYPELLAIVTEEVQGATLLDRLVRSGSWFAAGRQVLHLCDTLATVGRWVRAFQASDIVTSRVSPDDVRSYIDHRLIQLVAKSNGRFSSDDRFKLLRHIDQVASQVDELDWREVPIHGDLALGNVIIAGDKVVALDFAMSARGCRLLDISRVAMQIQLLAAKPHFRRAVLLRLQEALLGGFDDTIEARNPLFRLMTLLHRVNHLTTLTVAKTTFVEGLYNHFVRLQHERWIASELHHGEAEAA